MLDPFGLKPIPISGMVTLPVSGPLMTSANALFGNNSMLQLVSDNSSGMTAGETLAVLCEHAGLPFAQVKRATMTPTPYAIHCKDIASRIGSPEYDKAAGEALDETFASWFGFFNKAETAEYLLMITVFLANRAVALSTLWIYSTRPGLCSGSRQSAAGRARFSYRCLSSYRPSG